MRHSPEDGDEETHFPQKTKHQWTEFECPLCAAQNPREPFGVDDEVMCYFCGDSFVATINDAGKLRLKEL